MAKANGTQLTEHRLEKIEDRLDGIEGRLSRVEDGVKGINTTIRVVSGFATLLLLFLVGLVAFAGKSVVRDIARDVYREEFASRSTISQDGKLSDANALHGDEIKTSTIRTIQFRWELVAPVNPDKVASIRLQPRVPLPGVAMSAELADGGKACVMTLRGPADVIEPAMPIDATVLIETRS